ncbi:hypothetical protein [Streptomyces sp. NPDC054863]
MPLEDLARDPDLWRLVRHLVETDGVTAALGRWLGYAPRLRLLARSEGPVALSLRPLLHTQGAERAQDRRIQFLTCQDEVVMDARAVVVTNRLPLEARDCLRTTDTSLGTVLAGLRPRRHTLHWDALPGAGTDRAAVLEVTARLDLCATPVAWVNETFQLVALASRGRTGGGR